MRKIAGYELGDQLGSGELGTVYRGRSAADDREVAVKLLFTSDLGGDELEVWRTEFLANLEQARQLEHPSIARVLDGGKAGDEYFVVTEFVTGRKLSEIIRDGQRSVRERLKIALQIADALAVAHARGVTHHDLKPANIIVTDELIPKITDFGLVRVNAAVSDASPLPAAVRAHYRAPEQIYGKKSDDRTDIFSLGVVLFELMYQRRPFEGDTWIQIAQKILNVNPPELRSGSGEMPDPLARLIGRALAKSPLDRFQSPRELQRELQAIYGRLSDDTTSTMTVINGTDTPRQSKSDVTPIAGAWVAVHEGDHRRVVPVRGDEFTIGRRGENDLPLMEEHISRAHAKIEREGDDWILVDRESRHGTFLNRERIKRAKLRDNDRVDLGKGGRYRITFHTGSVDTNLVTSIPTSAPLARRDIELLLDVTRALNSTLSVDDVLNIIIDSALTFTGAERGYIMLRDDEDRFKIRIRRHIDTSETDATDEGVSTSVVERCLATEQPVLIYDVSEVPEFSEKESIVDLNLKSILAVPMVRAGGVTGVLYLDSRELRTRFKSTQLDLLMAFASHAAISLENARLYEMAIKDQLTGVYLRHHFDSRLNAEFQRAQRYRSPLSLVFIDIDHFKTINDTLGHPVGDKVLRRVGHLIHAAARNTDLAARYGGEEFVLLAPETHLDMASILAERLRATVANERHQVADTSVQVTISLGVAAYPGASIETPADLVRMADDALLKAKKLGRNRFCVAG